MPMISNFTRWSRFLATGSDAGIFHAADYRPDVRSAHSVAAVLAESGPTAVGELVGTPCARAEAKLFALAMAASPRYASTETQAAALAALPLAAPRARDLALFAGYAESMRGWGRALRTSVASWYLQQPAEDLAAQILRHPSRNLKRHRQILRRAHPKTADGGGAHAALFQWIANGGNLGHWATPDVLTSSLALVEGFARIQTAASAAEAVRCIEDYRLQVPQVPARWKGLPEVWEALFEQMTYRQLIGYLPAMTRAGLLQHGSEYAAIAVARIASRGRIRAAGVGPLRLVQAMRDYRVTAPRALEGVFDALEEAFHLSLAEQAPLPSKRLAVAIDATGSMQGAPVAGMPRVSAALAGAALALLLGRGAGNRVFAFAREVRPLERCKGSKPRLSDVLNEVRAKPSRSDLSAVVRHLHGERLDVDAIVVVTDRATKPEATALAEAFGGYLRERHPEARLVLVCLAPTVIDGWDAAAPEGRTMAVAGMNTQSAVEAIRAFLA